MIRFNQPKYILPLIILPFIYLFYYLFDIVATEEKVQEVELASINPTLPDPFLDEDNLKDKFDAFQEAYKNNRKSSAILEIDRREENEVQSRQTLLEEPSPDYQTETAVRKTTFNQPKRKNELDSYETQMKLFKAQMQYVDSLIQVEGEGDGMDSQEEERSIANSTEKASLEPEIVTDQWSFDKDESRRSEMEERSWESEVGSQESEDRRQKLEVRSQKLEGRRQELEVRKQELAGRSAEQQMVKTKSELSGPFNTIAKQENNQFIRAVIDEEIKVTKSSRVRLRLLEDIVIGQYSLRKGQFLFGVVQGFKPQRIEIGITSILFNGKILDVSLEIYDLDGMKGLYIPESKYRELTREVGENITSSQQLPSETSGNQQMQLITALAKDAFNTAARTASKIIRKQKALLKYNTHVYLIHKSN